MKPLPFAHLNLRRNPFGELTAAERTRLAFVDVRESQEHLQQPRSAIQIVGERGFGKTTHLLVIASLFPESSYVHLPEGQSVEIPATGEPLLIDEAQRLTSHQKKNVLRSNRRLILGTHEDFEQTLRRSNRPVLTLAADRFTDAAQVLRILNARIEMCRRDAGPIPTITSETAVRLFCTFGSDLRAIEHSMYHVFQQLRSIQDV